MQKKKKVKTTGAENNKEKSIKVKTGKLFEKVARTMTRTVN